MIAYSVSFLLRCFDASMPRCFDASMLRYFNAVDVVSASFKLTLTLEFGDGERENCQVWLGVYCVLYNWRVLRIENWEDYSTWNSNFQFRILKVHTFVTCTIYIKMYTLHTLLSFSFLSRKLGKGLKYKITLSPVFIPFYFLYQARD